MIYYNNIYIIILLIILFCLINNINISYIENFNDCKLLSCINGYQNINNSCIPLSLYTFTTFTFSNCNKNGFDGPTLIDCKEKYINYEWTTNTNYFNMIKQGIQIWTVPKTGKYKFTVAGAGNGSLNKLYGCGIIISAIFDLKINDKINILVGQIGYLFISGFKTASGGGGTFVTISNIDNTPLIIAGGGGGFPTDLSSVDNTKKPYETIKYILDTSNANFTTSGQIGMDGYYRVSSSGSDGNGGRRINNNGAGGGFLTDGGYDSALSCIQGSVDENKTCQSDINRNGKSFLNGGIGGICSNCENNTIIYGGFGGGGISLMEGNGGGGGYSGGSSLSGCVGVGGGGGSYISPTLADKDSIKNIGYNYLNGYVIIDLIS